MLQARGTRCPRAHSGLHSGRKHTAEAPDPTRGFIPPGRRATSCPSTRASSGVACRASIFVAASQKGKSSTVCLSVSRSNDLAGCWDCWLLLLPPPPLLLRLLLPLHAAWLCHPLLRPFHSCDVPPLQGGPSRRLPRSCRRCSRRSSWARPACVPSSTSRRDSRTLSRIIDPVCALSECLAPALASKRAGELRC